MNKVSEKEVVRPALITRGVKKRCRKENNHRFSLKDREPDCIDIEELKATCEKIIRKYMRSVTSAYLSLQTQTVSKYENGMEASTFMYGTDEKIDLEVPAL